MLRLSASTPIEPIQIDKSRSAGQRKHHCGKMLAGDKSAELNDSDAEVVKARNQGSQNDGLWEFGLK